MKSKKAAAYIQGVEFKGNAGFNCISSINAQIAIDRAEQELREEMLPYIKGFVELWEDLSKSYPLLANEPIFINAKEYLNEQEQD